jgi:cytochrome c oxidase cbb3-type subunit 3
MKPTPTEDPIREHTFDGIQEYDKRLPNWWLFTLYAAIIFAAGYWIYYEYPRTLQPDGKAVDAEMARIALAAQNSGTALSDDQIWTMSKDSNIVNAGKATFLSTCASCHNDDLSGKIGPNLKDQTWLHGGLPHEVIQTVTNGVPSKGMPTWGPVLGKQKISEVVAFVMSYHSAGEPIIDGSKK